jgi:nitrate reductase NapE component
MTSIGRSRLESTGNRKKMIVWLVLQIGIKPIVMNS